MPDVDRGVHWTRTFGERPELARANEIDAVRNLLRGTEVVEVRRRFERCVCRGCIEQMTLDGAGDVANFRRLAQRCRFIRREVGGKCIREREVADVVTFRIDRVANDRQLRGGPCGDEISRRISGVCGGSSEERQGEQDPIHVCSLVRNETRRRLPLPRLQTR